MKDSFVLEVPEHFNLKLHMNISFAWKANKIAIFCSVRLHFDLILQKKKIIKIELIGIEKN